MADDGPLSPVPPGYVRLDVGGQRYTILLGTLTKYPGSMLATMFSKLAPSGLCESSDLGGEDSSLPLAQDSEGSYIIDRDGAAFRYIANYLRHEGHGPPALLPTARPELLHLAAEAEYFMLDELGLLCRARADAPPKASLSHFEFMQLFGAGLRLMAHTDLRGVCLAYQNCARCDFSGCDFSGADMRGARFGAPESSFGNPQDVPARLQGANLRGANLMGAELQGAQLQGADLAGANLEGATLIGDNSAKSNATNTAQLAGASLRGANLRKLGITMRTPNDNQYQRLVALAWKDVQLEGAIVDDRTYAALELVLSWQRKHADLLMSTKSYVLQNGAQRLQQGAGGGGWLGAAAMMHAEEVQLEEASRESWKVRAADPAVVVPSGEVEGWRYYRDYDHHQRQLLDGTADGSTTEDSGVAVVAGGAENPARLTSSTTSTLSYPFCVCLDSLVRQ